MLECPTWWNNNPLLSSRYIDMFNITLARSWLEWLGAELELFGAELHRIE
jgi:hypothetical protein